MRHTQHHSLSLCVCVWVYALCFVYVYCSYYHHAFVVRSDHLVFYARRSPKKKIVVYFMLKIFSRRTYSVAFIFCTVYFSYVIIAPLYLGLCTLAHSLTHSLWCIYHMGIYKHIVLYMYASLLHSATRSTQIEFRNSIVQCTKKNPCMDVFYLFLSLNI